LKAIGLRDELAHTSIRFGLGRFNAEDEIDYTIQRVIEEVGRLRKLSPVYKTKRASVDEREQTALKQHERVS
jgi:cysteine desulfurase